MTILLKYFIDTLTILNYAEKIIGVLLTRKIIKRENKNGDGSIN